MIYVKISVLLKKLRLESREFVTASEMKVYCKGMKIKYDTAVRYLASQGHIVRILRGIFYVKSLDEEKLGKSRYSHLELVAKGLDIKGVKDWYFGLYSALKLNNMTHEHFVIEEVISGSLFRANPVSIAGHKFRFRKVSPKLAKFGVVSNGLIRYSDKEKTILDFIYIWRYNGVPEDRIVMDISDWAKGLSKGRIKKYAESYPKTVRKMASKANA